MIKVKKTEGRILTARPDGMPYEAYRETRKEQDKMIKNRLRHGFLVHSGGTLKGKVPDVKFE